MKKVALIAAVVFTTISLESCRQPDEFISNEEAVTLKKVQDSSSELKKGDGLNTYSAEANTMETIEADGEIVIPPRK